MRTSSVAAPLAKGAVLVAIAGGLCIAFGFGPGSELGFAPEPALAFDGTSTPSTASLTPSDGSRGATVTQDGGDKAKAFTALQYAADQGHLAAQWKVGRMYAAGDGVPHDDLRAFNYFSQIANPIRTRCRALRRRILWPTPSSH